MSSPVLELQEMMVARLKAELAVPVYDAVPDKAETPYVSVGPIGVAQDDADCIGGAEVSFQWDAWSTSSTECMTIAEAIRVALHDYETELTDNALVSLEHERTVRLRDPGGETYHAAVQFLALVEQP